MSTCECAWRHVTVSDYIWLILTVTNCYKLNICLVWIYLNCLYAVHYINLFVSHSFSFQFLCFSYGWSRIPTYHGSPHRLDGLANSNRIGLERHCSTLFMFLLLFIFTWFFLNNNHPFVYYCLMDLNGLLHFETCLWNQVRHACDIMWQILSDTCLASFWFRCVSSCLHFLAFHFYKLALLILFLFFIIYLILYVFSFSFSILCFCFGWCRIPARPQNCFSGTGVKLDWWNPWRQMTRVADPGSVACVHLCSTDPVHIWAFLGHPEHSWAIIMSHWI